MSIFFFFFFVSVNFGGFFGGGEVLAFLCNFRFCCLFVRFCRCGFFFMFALYLFTDL